mmetsp:Transcript_35243/g.82189  ORF Transcript_35243/g.82189 Transcript_35243/m.82189 type:complete len:201 (+) Transcript_35243:123-725(+)
MLETSMSATCLPATPRARLASPAAKVSRMPGWIVFRKSRWPKTSSQTKVWPWKTPGAVNRRSRLGRQPVRRHSHEEPLWRCNRSARFSSRSRKTRFRHRLQNRQKTRLPPSGYRSREHPSCRPFQERGTRFPWRRRRQCVASWRGSSEIGTIRDLSTAHAESSRHERGTWLPCWWCFARFSLPTSTAWHRLLRTRPWISC